MTSIVFGGESLRTISVPEAQYEAILGNYADTIFAGWTWIPWKPLLYAPFSDIGVRPDALLLNKFDESWLVVEVELAHHSVEGHIRPQLERIRYATYDTPLAETLPRSRTSLIGDFRSRILRMRPGFLCIADRDNSQIADACRHFDFEFAVATPLRASPSAQSGLIVDRWPRVLDAREVTGWFPVSRHGRPMGASEPVKVPQNFPVVSEISLLLDDGSISVLPVKELQGSRCLFLPSDLSMQLPGTLVLEYSDPAEHVFKLRNVKH